MILFPLFLSTSGLGQQAPFHRGVNLTNWFQADNATNIHYNRYSRQDLVNIKSLGFDVIRFPINLHYMTGGAPDYLLDPIFLEGLHQVADWAEELEIYLILDNHTFDPAQNTDPGVGAILEKVWDQMAREFAGRSEYILYEVLNEPHGITDALWNSIQKDVVETIRQVDTVHYIVIGPAGWNGYNNLSAMPVYEGEKLIYTFHFYDPFLFTHQGASWNVPSMIDVADIPFPYAAGEMPPFPASLQGTWVENMYNNYGVDGTVQKVRDLIDIAVSFRDQRGVPVFCGEFGVFQPNSGEEDRVYWYEQVREYLDSMEIPWTMWDYHGGFGLFEENSNGFFEHDLNVPLLEALDLSVPEQTEYTRQPDDAGMILYDDYMATIVRNASYSDGPIDFFSTDFPNNGKYCIHWTGASQYRNISLDFQPDRDLTQLVTEDFALDMMVRGDDPGISFDVRFLDSKTEDPDDLPWRMGTTINSGTVTFDGKWQHLHIPLSDLVETGAWYEQWYNPRGDFDWTDAERIEIVAEAKALGSANLWFDNIHLTDQDTAQVREDPTATPGRYPGFETIDVSVFPNPAAGQVQLSANHPSLLYYEIMNIQGINTLDGTFQGSIILDTGTLKPGIYILRLYDKHGLGTIRKLVVQAK